jgi:glycerophosphoryl diester phosphodiesterase
MRCAWLAVAGMLVLLAEASHAACPPGRFLLRGGPVLGAQAAGDALVLAPGGNVSLASGCEAVTAAEVVDRPRGLRVRVQWPRCGAVENVELKARFGGKDCGRVRGTLRADGLRRRIRGRREACTSSDQRCLRFANIAHRGGADLRPENTLAAFEHAVALGADVLEMDVHATADGVVVLHHDATVDRTTDGTGPIAMKTLAEVRALDAGHRFTPDRGATFPFRGQGIVVPTLEEVLTAFPDMPVSIEIKQYAPSIVGLVLDVLARTGAAGRAIVVSFDQATMDAVRAAAPAELLTGMSIPEMQAFGGLDAAGEATYVPPAPVAQLPYQSVSPAIMARAERFGIVVQVWTVNDAGDMRTMLGLGVHGVMTNDPATLESVLAAQ